SIQQPPLQAATAGPGHTEPNVTSGPARSQPPPGQRAAMKNAATWPRNVTNKGIVHGSSNYRTPIPYARNQFGHGVQAFTDHRVLCAWLPCNHSAARPAGYGPFRDG